jgi:hypothetical protein
MLRAAEAGTLRPDTRSFTASTLPPDDTDGDDEDGDRPTQPGYVPSSSAPTFEAELATPRAPGIPRAPQLPHFARAQDAAPSYAPSARLETEASARSLELEDVSRPIRSERYQSPERAPAASAQQPHSSRRGPVALDLGTLDGVSTPPSLASGLRNTAPSPGAPGADGGAAPTVFALATWLAERDFERVLRAVDELGAGRSPEVSLQETRALIGLGRKAAARRSLDRLCRAPLLEPELRAAVARLLLELGDVSRAEAQARRALSEEPSSEAARLTLAWAVVRSHAWLVPARSAGELAELLDELEPKSTMLPALAYALRAFSVLARSPDAARKAADAALSLEPMSHDALAAAAVVAARQGRIADAERLHQRLLELDRPAADDLSATLESLGAAAAKAPAAPAASSTSPAEVGSNARNAARAPLARSSPWEEAEQRLASGAHRAALEDFEQGLSAKLDALPVRAGARELSAAALTTARYLTQAPNSRHFAPFDLSLFSIQRLDAALGLLYRGNVGPRTELRTRVMLGLGAYVGECLRQAYAGEWVGSSADLLQLHIEGQGLCFTPFRDLKARLQAGQSLELSDTPAPHPGAEPLGQRVALTLPPPTPWDPAPWPSAAELTRVGAELGRSPVGLFCEQVELPLDHSFASLRSIDRYVTLLAPPLAPPDPEAAWVRRASVLVGAYVGEVLRTNRGGRWESPRGELCSEAYRLALPNGSIALPVAAALERLSGRRLEQPSDYARRISA